MKYVLVNKLDEIVDTVELTDSVKTVKHLRPYFQGVKQMPEREDFHKLWKVMSKLEYDSHLNHHYKTDKLNGGRKNRQGT